MVLDSDEDDACLTLVTLALLRKRRRRKRKIQKRRWWVKPWLLRRELYGQFETLMYELATEDRDGYRAFQRVCPEMFQELLDKVGHIIAKQDTNYRRAIPPEVRLALTLRFLATGQSYMSTMFSFRVGNNTIGRIVPETCRALYNELAAEYFKCPSTAEEWQTVADGFASKWQFPHCTGALDGKHIAIRPPPNSGSLYYCYKGFSSIVLMALADADYRFLYADVGTNGCNSDGGIFGVCDLKEALDDGSINFPDPEPLPGDDHPVPYFVLADDAFPLRCYLMKPYPLQKMTREQRIYNYRLSRARRVIENAFGIMANRFRVLLTTIHLEPDRVEDIVLACCVLHNLMRTKYPILTINLLDVEDPLTHQVTSGAWRSNTTLENLEVMKGNNMTKAAKAQRDYLRDYFQSPEGAVSWQDSMI